MSGLLDGIEKKRAALLRIKEKAELGRKYAKKVLLCRQVLG